MKSVFEYCFLRYFRLVNEYCLNIYLNVAYYEKSFIKLFLIYSVADNCV